MSKVEIMNKYKDAVEVALNELFDSAYEEGRVAGGGGEDTTPFDQAYVDAKIAEAVTPLNEQIQALNIEKDAKDALEEALADQMAALAQSLRDVTVKPV